MTRLDESGHEGSRTLPSTITQWSALAHLLVASLAGFVFAVPAHAEMQTTYISNFGRERPYEISGPLTPAAQEFTAGSSQEIGEIVVNIQVVSGSPAPNLAICNSVTNTDTNNHNKPSRVPGNACTSLTLSGTFGLGEMTFRASTPYQVAADTSYYVKFTAQSGSSYRLKSTDSNREDSGGLTGWSIGDEFIYYDNNNNRWTKDTSRTVLIAIRSAGEATTPNSPAAGAPTISGTAQVNQTLSAETSGITDSNGLANVSYSYQWIRVDADGTSNPADIPGATSATYTLVAADEGKRVKVKVTFDDDADNSEELTSTAYPSNGTILGANTNTNTNTNTLPVASDNTVTTNMDTSYTFDAGDFNFTDTDAGDALVSVKVTELESAGALALDGTDVTLDQVITKADIDAGKLTFTPAANASGDPYASFKFKVNDGKGESASAYIMTIDVLSGDPPGPPTGLSATLTGTRVDLSWAEPANSDPAITGYRIEHSAWYDRDQLWGNWTELVADTGSASTVYGHTHHDHGSNENYTLAPGVKLRYRVSAINAVGTGGPSNVSESTVPPAPDTAGNGAPNHTAVTINGDRIVVTFDEALVESEVPIGSVFEVLINQSSPRVEKVEVIGSTAVVTLSDADAVDSNDRVYIGYRPAKIFIGDTPVVIAENSLQDSEGNLVLGWRASQGQATNETLPSASHGTVRTGPGMEYTFTADDFNAYGDSLAAVIISSLPATDKGTLTLNGSNVTLDQSVTKEDIDAGKLKYTPPEGASGVPYTSFQFKVGDGTKVSVSSYTMTVEVSANELPTATDTMVRTFPDTEFSFSASDFNFTDGNSEDTLSSVRIVTLPGKGSLTLDGVDVAVNQVVLRTDIDNGGLVYAPVSGEEGEPYASFTFRVNDGTEESRLDYTMTVNVSLAPPRNNPSSRKTPTPSPQVSDAPLVALAGTDTVGAKSTADRGTRRHPVTVSTTSSLVVTWTEPDNSHCPGTCPAITHYELQYRQGTDGPWTDWPWTVEETETTIDVPDLAGAYEVRLRAVNAAGRQGEWSAPGFWSPALDAPVVTRSEGAAAGLDVRWTEPDGASCRGCPAVTHYDLQTRRYANGSWEAWVDGPLGVTGTIATVSVPDLAGAYEVRLRAVQGDGREGPWSAPGFWSPALDAPVVTRSEDAAAGLDVRWTEPDGASCRDCPAVTHYDLQSRRQTDGTWEAWTDGLRGVTETTATLTVPDLMGSYQVRVRAVHGDGREGEWSAPGQWSPPPELASGRLMKAWLSRFGRTVADQVIDAMAGRLEEPADRAGLAARIAGQGIGISDAQFHGQYDRYGQHDAIRGSGREPAVVTRGLDGQEVLQGTSFSYAGGSTGSGMASVWGRGAVAGFEGRDGDVDVDGTVRSLMLGTDFRQSNDVFGIMLAHSSGKGDYREGAEEEGRIRSMLTGMYPYAGRETGRLSLWGIAGFGKGEVTVYQDVSPYRTGASATADMDLAMAAGGVRGELLASGSEGSMIPAVDAVADVMAVRVGSDAAGEHLAAADADVSRLRMGLEGAWETVDMGGGRLTPTMRIGLRGDGGDADRGFGADYEGRLSWSSLSNGIRMRLRVHSLLTHEAEGFRERGASGSVSWDPAPGSNRGAAFSLTHSVVDTASWDLDSLLPGPGDHGAVARLAGADDARRDSRERIGARVGYGFGVFGGRFTGMPELGMGWTDGGRDYSVGWRLLREGSEAGAFEMLLEATRREDGDGGSRDGIGLRLRSYW